MTNIYELWDHKCPELEKLFKEEKVRFQGWACWCSPMERNYQVQEDDMWRNIDKCPFCNEPMTSYVSPSLAPMGVSIGESATCPECGHEFPL